MTWWCAATTLPWSWEWRAYPGVWVFVLLLLAGFARFGLPSDRAARRKAWGWFLPGLLLVWAALDWPIGTLGGGYLSSFHSLQYVMLALAAPPLMLLGLAPRMTERRDAGRIGRPARIAAHPATGLVVHNVIVLVTHFPSVVDQLMTSQLGSLVIDLAWITGGLALWWPALAPVGLNRLSSPLRMGYLFVQTLPSMFPAAFLTFAEYPLYRLYELAPRAFDLLTPAYDQQLAGLIMKVVGDPIIWVGIATLFFRWANAERRADVERQAGLPGRPASM